VVVSMSKQEFSRLEVLLRVQSGRLRVTDACELTGLRRRQVFRLLRGLKQDGATSLLSRHRGKPNHCRRAYAAAISFVARTGSFNTLHNALRLASRGVCLPVSQR
jgi:Winged helix-turn helix